MKILITGGTGFIGRKLVAHLKVNHEVVVLSRQGSRAYSCSVTISRYWITSTGLMTSMTWTQ